MVHHMHADVFKTLLWNLKCKVFSLFFSLSLSRLIDIKPWFVLLQMDMNSMLHGATEEAGLYHFEKSSHTFSFFLWKGDVHCMHAAAVASGLKTADCWELGMCHWKCCRENSPFTDLCVKFYYFMSSRFLSNKLVFNATHTIVS